MYQIKLDPQDVQGADEQQWYGTLEPSAGEAPGEAIHESNGTLMGVLQQMAHGIQEDYATRKAQQEAAASEEGETEEPEEVRQDEEDEEEDE